jgi:hypothetical protein
LGPSLSSADRNGAACLFGGDYRLEAEFSVGRSIVIGSLIVGVLRHGAHATRNRHPTAGDGSYDLAAYRAVFALQGLLILLACLAYFGVRDPLKPP